MEYRGSLARRVLFGSILLFGLPLLVHTFFLYRREYRENINDAFSLLRTLTEGRVLYLGQLIQCQQDVLSGLLDNLPEDREARTAFLNKEAPEYHMSQFRVIEQPEDDRMKKESFIFIDRNNKELIVGTKLTTDSVFIIATPTDFLLEQIQHKSIYPIGLSLIDEEGVIFLTTDPRLQDEQYARSNNRLKWVEENPTQNFWFLQTDLDSFLAVIMPIKDTDYFLMANVSEKSVAAIQTKDYILRISLFLLFSCVLGGGFLLLLTWRVSKPFVALCSVMQRISEGALHMRYTPDRMGFEINKLGIQLNEMLDALLLTREREEKERNARERLAQELHIGHQIQKNILPTDFSGVSCLEAVPGYHSALEVSGDFYDVFPLPRNRILLAIADAAGKGISACLFSLIFRSMLRSIAATREDLASIVRTANDLLLCDTLSTSFFITSWIGIFDYTTNSLSYCSQGHPPALLLRGTTVDLLSTQGISLGVQPINPLVNTIQLDPEDLLFLYTDGITEAQNRSANLFGLDRLKNFFRGCNTQTLQQDASRLLAEIKSFCGNAAQSDDVTFLLVRIHTVIDKMKGSS